MDNFTLKNFLNKKMKINNFKIKIINYVTILRPKEFTKRKENKARKSTNMKTSSSKNRDNPRTFLL